MHSINYAKSMWIWSKSYTNMLKLILVKVNLKFLLLRVTLIIYVNVGHDLKSLADLGIIEEEEQQQKRIHGDVIF